MNHRGYDDDRYQKYDKQQPPQLRSPPPRDGSPRSDMAALNGKPRKSDYIPYQDAVYYNNDNSGSYGSDDRYSDRDRYGDKRYSEVYERVRRRRRNGTEDSWENHRYPPARLPLSQYNVRKKDDQDSQQKDNQDAQPPPMNGKEQDDQNDRNDRKSRRGDRRSRSSSSSRSRSTKRRGRASRRGSNDDDNDDSRSRSRSKSRIPGKKPDPNLRPQDDPNRPAEKYTALKAIKAAAWAGGVEVVRCRMEPGPWTGQKGKRVALAATVGVAIGALRNGKNQHSGKVPYAEAAMTGFYAIDFLKRVARHTEHGKNAMKEQEQWNMDADYLKDREDRAKKWQSAR